MSPLQDQVLNHIPTDVFVYILLHFLCHSQEEGQVSITIKKKKRVSKEINIRVPR